MENSSKNPVLEDDSRESVELMVEHRLPWLAVGLLGGILATVLASKFEILFRENIELSFFIPVIVYMASAMGTQTENVFVRNISKKRVKFSVYLLKEIVLGFILGIFFGSALGGFAYLWFGSMHTALSVGISTFVTMSIAPVVALSVPEVLWKRHTDPAIGSGPFVTIIQDLLSLLIYFAIATVIIF